MLEGFDIPGLGTLNAVAAFFLGTAILVMILGLGYGMTLFVSGKTGGGSQRTTKGLQTSGLALVGAAVLGSIGGMIHWSMDQGDSELMPVAAQPQEIIIDKEPASVSCSAVTRDFTDEIEDLLDSSEPDHDMNDEHIQWAVELVGEEYEYEVDRAIASNLLQSVSWHPDGRGGDCDVSNETVQECTEVTFETIPAINPINEELLIEGPECEES